jgi:succinate-semialdehyde dehydrogenase / glutarate-semialdehyde dehydrogenase
MTQPAFHTTNPATGEAGPSFAYQTDAQVEALLATASTAARAWGSASFAERAVVLRSVAQLLKQERAALAQTISIEMGKPLVEAEGEIDKSAWNCEFVA